MNDEYFISDYNIIEGSLIILVLRLRGGSKISTKDNPIEEEKIRKEEEKRRFYFKYLNENFYFSYDGNLTIKEMLTDFFTKINSKETPEKLIILYECQILHPQIFSKKIKEFFLKKKPSYIIRINEGNHVIGGRE